MLDGAARVDDLVAAAVADGQPALGITDHGNLYGVFDFYAACKARGVGPIIGTEAYMAGTSRARAPVRRGRVDDTAVTPRAAEALLPPDAARGVEPRVLEPPQALVGRVPRGLLLQAPRRLGAARAVPRGPHRDERVPGRRRAAVARPGDERGALDKAARLQDIFGADSFFVELQDHGLDAQRTTNPKLVEIARTLNAPLLATNDSHYTHRGDATAHDALLCVQTGALLSDERFRFEGTEHYLKSAARCASSSRASGGVRLDVADRRARRGRDRVRPPSLPEFEVPERSRARRTRSARPRTCASSPTRGAPAVRRRRAGRGRRAARLRARRHRIDGVLRVLPRRVGPHPVRTRAGDPRRPGRGSSAGCCVAYCLQHRRPRPIRYGLMFERS